MEYYTGLFLLFVAMYFGTSVIFISAHEPLDKVLPIILMMVSSFFALSHLGFIIQIN